MPRSGDNLLSSRQAKRSCVMTTRKFPRSDILQTCAAGAAVLALPFGRQALAQAISDSDATALLDSIGNNLLALVPETATTL